MLKYLIILLDDSAVSYCHYNVPSWEPRLIDGGTLAAAIRFGMKENLMIQFVYPAQALPPEYEELIDSVDHVNIKPAAMAAADDIAVGGPGDAFGSANVAVRLTLQQLADNIQSVAELVADKQRVNLVLTDMAELTEADTAAYGRCLDTLADAIAEHCKNGGNMPQLNILTDRLTLTEMNNCNAGHESLTVAPDGKFYVCPAFYYDGLPDCGPVTAAPEVKNQQLYWLSSAPICRNCDAWQCHRCVWLNKRKTLEVNTPGRIQCVMSHLERNASRRLLDTLRKAGEFMPGTEIPELSYLDPFENIVK